MKTIWKFPIESEGEQTLIMPEGAEILTVQTQHGRPCIWAMVNPDATARQCPRRFLTIGTGQEMPFPSGWDQHFYIGTFQLDNGHLVFHLFEIR